MTIQQNLDDRFDLQRFLRAQETVYQCALSELKAGRKHSHWMWFIFPQIAGLGFSATSKLYAIKSREEAQAYLRHPILGNRLRECAEAVLAVENRSAAEIFGAPDDLKLKSSLTLFDAVSPSDPLFDALLAKYFEAKRDTRTLELLNS